MYENFFGLKIKPFDLVPDPDFLFFSRSHKKAVTYLNYGIKEKIGFILMTGEVGSGKTTIVRNLIRGLNSNVRLSKIFNTKVSSEQLLAMINEDFGLHVNGKDKITLVRELNDFLIDQYMNNNQPILLIDEAQNLSPEVLEEIRLLSNLETDRNKLLQIILVGQPELRQILAQPELRQIRQRISINCHIAPLTRSETEEYILHRLNIAGNQNAVAFQDGTIDMIYEFSRGIPRLINIICDFLMLAAYVEETRELSPDFVREVIGDIESENAYWKDEAPEKLFFGSESVLQEIVNRLNRIEEEFFRATISQTEKVEIFERLSALENLITKIIGDEKTYIQNIREEIAAAQAAMEPIQAKLMSLSDSVKELQDEYARLKDQQLTERATKIKEERRKGHFFLQHLRDAKRPDY
jgi:general secretion pathway protein A